MDANDLPPDHPLLQQIDNVFAAHLTGDLLDGAMVPEVFNALVTSLQGDTREEILELARDASTLIVERISDSTRRGIAQVLFEALERQYSVDKTGRMLRQGLGLTPQQIVSLSKFEAELVESGLDEDRIETLVGMRTRELRNERAKVIAQTEMRNAVEAGEHVVATRRGMTHKVNVNSGDAKVSDICLECSAAGPIPIDQDFPSGRKTAPHHPLCRCNTKYVFVDDPAQFEAARRRAEDRVQRVKEARLAAEAMAAQLAS